MNTSAGSSEHSSPVTAIAAGPASGLPVAAAAMITGAAAAVGVPLVAVRAMLAQWRDHEATRNMQFYFLYATNSRLARLAE
ncbi:hypothetical protein OH799_07055 [Nocardia sp. NBC_00881]|uniref:hypothetical protein n=1 Tax=Nocardia sp. NBC_00881 TaxID=2975995 RepID=UPI003867A81A|nr:hypothetical protein OH799_07055 [Nocardia sp. NBC_00881]